MEKYIYTISLLSIAISCTWLVFHPTYNDTFVQRLALVMMAFASFLRAYELGIDFATESNTRFLLTQGIALYLIATLVKHYRASKRQESRNRLLRDY